MQMLHAAKWEMEMESGCRVQVRDANMSSATRDWGLRRRDSKLGYRRLCQRQWPLYRCDGVYFWLPAMAVAAEAGRGASQMNRQDFTVRRLAVLSSQGEKATGTAMQIQRTLARRRIRIGT